MLWIEDPVKVLLDPNRAMEFLPVIGQDAVLADRDEQLNSLMRFAIYFAIVMVLIGRVNAAVFAIIVAGSMTLALSRKQKSKEDFAEGDCRGPKEDNPFMNPMPYDDPTISGACDVDDPDVRRRQTLLFEENLYKDVSDVFASQASDRQYYTVPVTTVPNDQTGFARWLYDNGPTCKEDQSRCRH